MLFLRECKKAVFSVAYLILIAGMILMIWSQDAFDFRDRILEMPRPGQESYGTQLKEIPELIMPAALLSLYGEFMENRYTAYPIGFIKVVRLNDSKQKEIAGILEALSGEPAETLLKAAGEMEGNEGGRTVINGGELVPDGNGGFTIEVPGRGANNGDDPQGPISLKPDITYDLFKTYMDKADKLIGGGSSYDPADLKRFSRVPLTYEEALASYNLIVEKDGVTGAYARLFTDYLCLTLSVLPVILASAISLKDRKSGIKGILYTRQASSLRIVLTRYAAIVTVVMIPAILLAYVSNTSVWSAYKGITLDYLAPFKYTMGWILPSVMVSSALGLFLTELTNTPVAIAVQGFWWFVDMNLGVSEIEGGYSLFRLTPRHNSLQNTLVFIEGFGNLAANRLFFTGVALLLTAGTVIVYEKKRRGGLNGFAGKIRSNSSYRRSQSAA